MSDMKQVKIDNWGVFFLQRLQQFFNRTDFCDLTLQFENNVQLKVHRLVMNACTEYFQLLENTCEVVDDCLVMPLDLQPDVVVPIVNFMYTGQLEFQMSNFDKLYAAAKLMNLTVLTKLLDAQKVPVTPMVKSMNKRNSVGAMTWNMQGKKIIPKTEIELPETLPGRKIPVWKRKHTPSYSSSFRPSSIDVLEPVQSFKTTLPKPLDNTPRPTRFEWPEDDVPSEIVSSFDDISYGSQPLATPIPKRSHLNSSIAFEEIKKTAQTLKRPNNQGPESVNLQDVKEYLQEQKLRNDYILKNDERISSTNEDSNDDYRDDAEIAASEVIFGQIKDNTPNKSILKPASNEEDHPPTKKVRFSLEGKENTSKGGKPHKQLIQAKLQVDNCDLSNHTKIISEVLKKYPHLVQRNKNIKLKIMKKNSIELENASQLQSFQQPQDQQEQVPEQQQVLQVQQVQEQQIKPIKINNPEKCDEQLPKQTENVGNPVETNQTDKTLDDSEMVESWQCKECNIPNEYIQLRSYPEYHDHIAEFHPEKIDSRVCEYCGHKSARRHLLVYHQYMKHSVTPPAPFAFPQCQLCDYIALNNTLLHKHQAVHRNQLKCQVCNTQYKTNMDVIKHCHEMDHNENMNFDCEFCHKKFVRTTYLIAHMRTYHKTELETNKILDDPIFDKRDQPKKEIKIISNIPLSTSALTESLNLQQKSSAELTDTAHLTATTTANTETLVNVTTNHGIASLGLVVLDQNQQFVLQTPTTENSNEYIIPEITEDQLVQSDTPQTIALTVSEQQNAIIPQANIVTTSTPVTTTDELVMVLTDHDYGDGNNQIITSENSNIVVLYSHPVEGQDTQYISSEGNIVLSSQTGVIEMNGHQIQVTNSETLNIATEEPKDGEMSQDVEPEESIEMIQQEINSHFQTNTKVPDEIISSDTIQTECSDVQISADVTNDETIIIEDNVDKETNPTVENEIVVVNDVVDGIQSKENDTNVPKELSQTEEELEKLELEPESDENHSNTNNQIIPSENIEPEPMDVEEEIPAPPQINEDILKKTTLEQSENSTESTNKSSPAEVTSEISKGTEDIHLDEPMDIDEGDHIKNEDDESTIIIKETASSPEKTESSTNVAGSPNITKDDSVEIINETDLNDIVTIPEEESSENVEATVPTSDEQTACVKDTDEEKYIDKDKDKDKDDNFDADEIKEEQNSFSTDDNSTNKQSETTLTTEDISDKPTTEDVPAINDTEIENSTKTDSDEIKEEEQEEQEEENLGDKNLAEELKEEDVSATTDDKTIDEKQKEQTTISDEIRTKDNLTALVSDWCDDDSGLQGHTNDSIISEKSNETDIAGATVAAPTQTQQSTNTKENINITMAAEHHHHQQDGTTNKIANVKITKLLDDWDDGDTDSQNSGETTQTRKNPINNLIEDWEDDE